MFRDVVFGAEPPFCALASDVARHRAKWTFRRPIARRRREAASGAKSAAGGRTSQCDAQCVYGRRTVFRPKARGVLRYAVRRLMPDVADNGGASGALAVERAVQVRTKQTPQPSTLFAKAFRAQRPRPKTIFRLSSGAGASAGRLPERAHGWDCFVRVSCAH